MCLSNIESKQCIPSHVRFRELRHRRISDLLHHGRHADEATSTTALATEYCVSDGSQRQRSDHETDPDAHRKFNSEYLYDECR